MGYLNTLTAADISRCVANPVPPIYEPPPQAEAGVVLREAGVLIPFVRQENEWHLLFIRRPASERDLHSGQVAFAGGKREHTDPDLKATALRETHEEIGVDPQHVNVLGQLAPHRSLVSRFAITPVIGTFPWPCELILSPQEVARAFTIPLKWLADPNHHEIRQHRMKDLDIPLTTVYFQEYDGELLWGATARITLSLLTCLQKAA